MGRAGRRGRKQGKGARGRSDGVDNVGEGRQMAVWEDVISIWWRKSKHVCLPSGGERHTARIQW